MFLVIFITAIFLLISVKYYYSTKKYSKKEYRELEEIPCPDQFPLLGNLTDIFLSEVESWKIARKRALKCYPIYRLKMLHKNLVYILSPDDIGMIYGNLELTVKGDLFDIVRDWFGPGLPSIDGKLWNDRRKLMSKMFTLSALDKYSVIFNNEIEIFLNELEEDMNKPINKYSDIGISIFKIFTEIIAGKNFKMDRNHIMRVATSLKVFCKMVTYHQIKPYLKIIIPFTNFKKEQEESREVFHSYSKMIIQKLRDTKNFGEALPEMLNIMMNNPKYYDEDNMRFEMNNFLSGGHETPATTTWIVLKLLADYPEHQDEIYQEIQDVIGDSKLKRTNIAELKRLDQFVKESMRMFPPVIFTGRNSVNDIITKTGYRIPAGTNIMLPIFDVHRNPNVFPEPNVFNPDRFTEDDLEKTHPFAFIPFGAGPRRCIAEKYAMLQLKMFVCAILKRFKLESTSRLEDSILVTDVFLRTQEPTKIRFLDRKQI